MDLKSRPINRGRRDKSMSCHGQWQHDMSFSLNEHSNKEIYMSLLLSDFGNVSDTDPDQSWCDHSAHDPDFFQDNASGEGDN